MTAPRFATWLLIRFSSGPHAEAIAGDLMERYTARPSRLWYWRQVISAIGAAVIGTASTHRGRTVVAVVIGAALYFAAPFPTTWTIRATAPFVNDVLNAMSSDSYAVYRWSHLLQRTLIDTIACMAIGWMVSRCGRRSAPVAACILAVAVLLFQCGMIAWLMATSPSPQPRDPWAYWALSFVMVRPMGILVGGVLGARPILSPSASPSA